MFWFHKKKKKNHAVKSLKIAEGNPKLVSSVLFYAGFSENFFEYFELISEIEQQFLKLVRRVVNSSLTNLF